MRYAHPSALAPGARFLIVAAILSTGSALSQKDEPDAPPRQDRADKAAFEAVCGACHPASLADGLRSESEWGETVEQMVKAGAKGTGEQFERVMRFLLRTLTKVNVNTATASEIAPVLDISGAAARALVKRRTEKGNFKTLEDLKRVPGVDATKLEARQDRVAF
jgi:competence protein ComEA